VVDYTGWAAYNATKKRGQIYFSVAAYRHSGFAGGINYYRNPHENWRLMQPWRDAVITCPVLFVAGSADRPSATHQKHSSERE
jgi:hypothetical protein